MLDAATSNRMILAHANYWLRRLDSQTTSASLTATDLDGMCKALAEVISISDEDAWKLSKELATTIHPHLEWRARWDDWEDALTLLQARARQHSDLKAEAEWLLLQGNIRERRGVHRAAVSSYRQAWRLYLQAGEQVGRGRALSNLGYLYSLLGRFERAEILCCAALAIFEEYGDQALLAYTSNHLGWLYRLQERWSEAKIHLSRAETLWRQADENEYGLAKILINLGEVERYTGNYGPALSYYQQAIEHFQALGDNVYVALVQMNIGNLYLNQNELLQAEMYYSKAESIFLRYGGRLGLAKTRHNLGMVYTGLKSWTEAKNCFERAMDYWRNAEDDWHLANTLGDLTLMYLEQGDITQARACLDKAWALVDGHHSRYYDILKGWLTEREEKLRRQ